MLLEIVLPHLYSFSLNSNNNNNLHEWTFDLSPIRHITLSDSLFVKLIREIYDANCVHGNNSNNGQQCRMVVEPTETTLFDINTHSTGQNVDAFNNVKLFSFGITIRFV